MKILIHLICLAACCCGTAVAVESMSMSTYKRLQAIEALMAANKLQAAGTELEALLARMPRSKTDRAYIYYTAALLNLRTNATKKAQRHFLSALELDRFPDKTRLYVLQTLAGLSMQEEAFEAAIAYYQDYLQLASEAGNEILLGLGSAYFYNRQYPETIETVTTALQNTTTEDLYRLLFASYYELKQFDKGAGTLEEMIRLWPARQQYWQHLYSLYIEQEKYAQALEIMEAALNQGFLATEADILQYVHLLYQEHLPHKAARVLQGAMDHQKAGENLKNYELLATLFQRSKERLEAIEALKKASTFAEKGNNDFIIAQLLFEMETSYEVVVTYAQRAIQKGIEQEGGAHMLIAVASMELGDDEAARKHLTIASQFDETRQEASQWLTSLE